MSTYNLTLQYQHFVQLQNHLIREDGCEHAAYILCNSASARHDPWDREMHMKFLVSKVIPVPDDQVVESTDNLITWQTASFVKVLKEAIANDQIAGIVHSHPTGIKEFSEQDDMNEPDLVKLAVNRNGIGTKMLSLILTPDGNLCGRVWLNSNPGSHEPMRMICSIGERFHFHYPGRGNDLSMPSFQRQALAFGHALNQDLRHLRISIVGCGGTGSAAAMLLARLGVGQLALIDNDIVDQTNLNRLHGARQADADAMLPKVNVVTKAITELGLGVRTIPIEAWVGDPTCRDVLKSSHIIFGCTDDHEGRLFLNRFAYYYLIPVIDMGMAIDLGDKDSLEFRALDGRVTVLVPNHACLLCRGVINPEIARSETMQRSDPGEYEQRKAEAYVVGEGIPNPAVVTFTTELACMAVNEMIHRLQGFRGEEGAAANRVRKFHLNEDRRPSHKPSPACPVCANEAIWGKGDTVPFLGRIG